MDALEPIFPYLAALLPTVGVAFLFYLIIKYMLEADRAERKALAKWQKEHPESSSDNNHGPVKGASRTNE